MEYHFSIPWPGIAVCWRVLIAAGSFSHLDLNCICQIELVSNWFELVLTRVELCKAKVTHSDTGASRSCLSHCLHLHVKSSQEAAGHMEGNVATVLVALDTSAHLEIQRVEKYPIVKRKKCNLQ